MALAMMSILVAKYTLISVAFINAPYVFPIGMVIEYFMIELIFYLLFGNKKWMYFTVLNVNIFTSLCAPVFFNPTMDIHMEESKIENSSDHQVSPSLDPSTNETSTGIPAKKDGISRD